MDDLSTRDKIAGPVVSLVRRFHCSVKTYLELLVGLDVPEFLTGLSLGVEDGSLEKSHPFVHLQTG